MAPCGTALMGRGVVSFTSHFYHASLDMRAFEVLSRGSGTLVRSPSAASADALLLLVSHHVAAPFLFPALFPQPFLALLDAAHVRCSVELRDGATGRVLSQVRLDPRRSPVVGHVARDVAAVALRRDELDALLAGAGAVGSALRPLPLAAERPLEGAAVEFVGHFVKQTELDAATGLDTSVLLPRTVTGRVLGRSNRQVFCRSSPVLEMGMCGGAVLSVCGDCVGVVEGVVPFAAAPPNADGALPSSFSAGSAEGIAGPAERARRLIAGCAVFVEADELQDFLASRHDEIIRPGPSRWSTSARGMPDWLGSTTGSARSAELS